MARPRKPGLRVRHHTNSDTAVVDYYDPGSGKRRQIVLGKWGSPEVEVRFQRLVADLAACRRAQPDPLSHNPSVLEIATRFLKWCPTHYRHQDGKPTNEVVNYRNAVAVLLRTEGKTSVSEFGPLALKRVREAMVAKGWARKTVNAQIGRVKRIWRWAAENELIPPDRWHGLAAVRGLGIGRTSAREMDPVQPVADDVVMKTLPFLPPTVAAMVRFHLIVGCRSQDVCALRLDAIDRSKPVWVFRPARHKTSHRGAVREIFIGPRAQEALQEQIAGATDGGYLFSPKRSVAAFHANRLRETPKYPSHMRRNEEARVENPARPPLDHYTTGSYCRAVARACQAAGVEPWSPGQLRHSAATRFRREFGLELTRVLLGHSSAITSEIYADRDRDAAAAAAAKAG